MTNKIKEYIQEKWQLYPIQLVGISLLVLALFLGSIHQFGVGWICFGIVGAITLSCVIRNEIGEPTRTVSQVIQDLTRNKLVDYIVGVLTEILAVYQHFAVFENIDMAELTSFEFGMITAYWPLVMGLAIHFFANKE